MNPSRQTRDPAARLLTREECSALVDRIAKFATRGGETLVGIDSNWTGNLRWARNTITTSGDVRVDSVDITRNRQGGHGNASVDQLDDATLESAVRRAERLLISYQEYVRDEIVALGSLKDLPPLEPDLWSDQTYRLDAPARADAMRELVKSATAAGVLAAGYIQVSAQGMGSLERSASAVGEHADLYCRYTWAQYSVTVRDSKSGGSGWAGVDRNDWGHIDAERLSAVALEKCLASRNPVALEPGRYTTILEPQAAGELTSLLFDYSALDRYQAEFKGAGPFAGVRPPDTKIGERVIDERISITSDPTDPECGFPGFSGPFVYPALTWIDRGVLKEMSCSRGYAYKHLFRDLWIDTNGAFHVHVHGPTTTVEEMIATTQRGVLVTRFSGITMLDETSMLASGYTRDGLWLIEGGKISKPVQNFRFVESFLAAANNIQQLGQPQRIFRPYRPVVAPALKIRDFNFASLADAL